MIIETFDLRLLLKLVENINVGMDYSKFTPLLKRDEKRVNCLTDNNNIDGHIDQKVLSTRVNGKKEVSHNNSEEQKNKEHSEKDKNEEEIRKQKERNNQEINNEDKNSKDKDIVVIIDESRKHKDELDEQIEFITLKMDGFERIHLEQYQKQLDEYKRFLAEYLRDANNAASSPYSAYNNNNDDDKQRKFEWGQEVVTYGEIKDIVRRIQMNALLGAGSNGDLSGHNQVSWQEAQDYKFWKYCSKFNEQMSFVIHDLVGSGG